MSKEEIQLQELEALEAIYPRELEIVIREYPNIAILISLNSSSDDKDMDFPCVFNVKISVQLPADYPDELPVLTLIGLDSLFSAKRIERVLDELYKVAKESLGMPMDNIGILVEDLKNEKERLSLQKIEEEEAITRKKFEGTAVTPQSFMEWKLHFDIELEAALEKEKKAREAALSGKLTGRQLFLRDATLSLSDFAVIQAAGNIEIDESLFDEDLEEFGVEDAEGSSV